MTFLFDSSVYIRILVDANFARDAEPVLRRIAPRLYLSSVVRAELTQGVRGDAGRLLVERLALQLERVGRVVTPSHDDWVHAAMVQSKLWDASPTLRTKRMLHDILLAISAQRIGARIVTHNERDFVAFARWVPTKRYSAEALLAPLK